MSDAVGTLNSLLNGAVESPAGLLESTRLEGFGGELFGQEAIVAVFRRAALQNLADAQPVCSAQGLALVTPAAAVVADLYQQRLGRLWVIGGPHLLEMPPAISVPFDPDLSQARGGVFFQASDHPDLDPSHSVQIVELLRLGVLAEHAAGAFRARLFVRRAFSEGARCVILSTLVTWEDGGARRVLARGLATLVRFDGSAISVHYTAVDSTLPEGSAAAWLPRA